MLKKIMISSLLLLLVGCSQKEVIYEAGEYIKGDTLPFGVYYTDNSYCTMIGVWSDKQIEEYIANGGPARSTFFTLSSFKEGDLTYFLVKEDDYDTKVTLGYGPGVEIEEGIKQFGVCEFKKLKLN